MAPSIHWSASPQVRKSASPQVRKSASPQVRKSANRTTVRDVVERNDDLVMLLDLVVA